MASQVYPNYSRSNDIDIVRFLGPN